MKLQIVFATGNQNKVREVHEILGDPELSIYSMKEVGLVAEPEENGSTFEENALIKARAVAELLRGQEHDASIPVVVLSDDSGLEVDALDGAPGIYSARYLGRDTSYSEKMHYIMDQLEGLPEEQRTARFACACACVIPYPVADRINTSSLSPNITAQSTELGWELVVRGTMEGMIGHEIAGEHGFGYDPFFYLPEYGKTSAEITPVEKNAISHRGKAFRAMLEGLQMLNFTEG